MEKELFSTNSARKTGYPYIKKKKFEPYFSHHIKKLTLEGSQS